MLNSAVKHLIISPGIAEETHMHVGQACLLIVALFPPSQTRAATVTAWESLDVFVD